MIVFHSTSGAADKTNKIQISEKNQKVRRKSEKWSNFRNFPDFSEDLATLV
jgi:hypothetical protein